jgi:hypothetical protein
MRHPQPHPAAARPILEATKVNHLPSPGRSEVTYMVLAPVVASPKGDKRTEKRWRSHLRSAKIVDVNTRVLTESQIRDRSKRGARLRIAKNIPLPRRIRFVDEIGKRVFEAAVAWQRGCDIGVSVLTEIDPRCLTRAELMRLGLKIRRPDY